MPAISPEAISNRIRLTNEFRALPHSFVAERGAVDPRLPFAGAHVSTVIDELPPDPEGRAVLGAQDDLFARPNKEFPESAIPIPIS
jgi:hypothetical protein